MQLDTPEGKLTIDDDALTFEPADDGATLSIGLNPMPTYEYQRGVYGLGTLVVGDSPDTHVIVLNNDQASAVIEELRRPRNASKSRTSGKSETKTDSDTATAK
jgi:hypothetical protein